MSGGGTKDEASAVEAIVTSTLTVVAPARIEVDDILLERKVCLHSGILPNVYTPAQTNCPAPSCSSWKNTCRNRSRLWPATYLGGNKEDVDMFMRVFDDHLERNSCANDLHADGDRARPIYALIGKLLPWRGWCTALSRRRFADWHAGGGDREWARGIGLG
ncbi:hypothetical protein BD310DRAFT_260608 [Dichomitus squalens]|uniref:Uncharacterized protein n=1 Tax=Dichomitus squalens TaxID=114155 RepID=A0A4Q9PG67_9APHY|nr:hypothetical protein BD310DRAFT_260608 [Dichomitus squalens]